MGELVIRGELGIEHFMGRASDRACFMGRTCDRAFLDKTCFMGRK